MHLGQDALQSLQIFDQEAHANLHFSATKEGLSLFGILNECITLNGKLLLKNWLLRPSTEVKVIQSRADQIECFLDPKNGWVFHLCPAHSPALSELYLYCLTTLFS